MPTPVSSTSKLTVSAVAPQRTVMRPPFGVYLIALSTRLSITCRSASGSAHAATLAGASGGGFRRDVLSHPLGLPRVRRAVDHHHRAGHPVTGDPRHVHREVPPAAAGYDELFAVRFRRR